MKYYIISGEKSGDLYGGYLMKSLAKYHNKNAKLIYERKEVSKFNKLFSSR